MPDRQDIEAIKEQLLIASEQQAEALRAYLAEEQARRRAEELLEQCLRSRHDRGLNFCI